MSKPGSSHRIQMGKSDLITYAICRLICLFFLVIFALPLIYVIFSSIHYRGSWSFDGYALLLQNETVITGLKNSIFLASIGTLYSLCLEIPAAYVISQKKYRKLSGPLFMLGQFGVAILPLYLLLKQLHLIDTLWALILPCGFSVYYTHLLRARMMNIARDLEDAAAVDGAGRLVYLMRIMVPVLGPTIGCIAFFHICSFWSSTLYAQTFLLDESKYPLSIVLLELLIKNRSTDVLVGSSSVQSIATVQMAEYALCVLSAAPLISIFLLIKKHVKVMDVEGGSVL